MRLRKIVSLVAMLISMVLAGCGQGATPGVTQAPPPTAAPTGLATPTQPIPEETQPAGPAETAELTQTPADILVTPLTQEELLNITPIPTPSDPGLQQQVEQARQDLAANLGVNQDEIVLVELEPVVWPDSSLGCPQPGMAYAQVQVEGLRIRLLAGERVYDYHSGGGTPPFLCVQPE